MKEKLIQLKASPGIAMAYFYNDHCAPCMSLRPKVRELAQKFAEKIEILMINTDADPALSAENQVFSAPVVVLYADGQEYRRFSKYISVSELEETIERLQKLMQ